MKLIQKIRANIYFYQPLYDITMNKDGNQSSWFQIVIIEQLFELFQSTCIKYKTLIFNKLF